MPLTPAQQQVGLSNLLRAAICEGSHPLQNLLTSQGQGSPAGLIHVLVECTSPYCAQCINGLHHDRRCMHAQARSNACLPALPHHSPHASCSAIPHRQSLARCASCRFHPSICQPKPLLLPRCATVHCTSDTPPNTTTHTPGQPAMQVRSSHSSMPTAMSICHPSASLAVSFFYW